MDGYIGTYYSESSKGIYRFSFDSVNGRVSEPELFYEAPNAKWISLNGRSMVFPIEKQGRAGVCFLTLDNDGKVIRSSEILEEKHTPCYILQHDNLVYTANYHEGNVMVYSLEESFPLLVKRIENGEGAGCHQILLHDTFLMVPCLEQNRIRLFDMNQGFNTAGQIIFPVGSGPRHAVFNNTHTKLYTVSERSNELFVFQVNGQEFVLTQTVCVLPDNDGGSDSQAAAAAVRLSKDGRFLYVSVRGTNNLTVFDVSGDEAVVVQYISSGGVHPRDFILSEDERYLLVVNRFEGGIVSFKREKDNGTLIDTGYSTCMQEGVSLVIYNGR